MKVFHELKKRALDLSNAISGHSGDECIIYKTVNGEPCYLAYYFPPEYDRSQKYPVFFFVHGGGWVSHKIFEDQEHWQGDYLGFLARYYANKGFVSVGIDYRLARDAGQTEHYGMLQCYEDCCDALDYVLAHADEYGIDTWKMYLLGESAGGHLAGALATFHYDRCYAFRKVFLVNPITHFEDRWEKMIPMNSSHSKLANLTVEERATFLSPLYQVQKGNCQVVLIHGNDDTTVDPEHSLRFYDRMLELGCQCELHLIEQTKHAFLLAEYYKDGPDACKTAIGIIDECVKKSL